MYFQGWDARYMFLASFRGEPVRPHIVVDLDKLKENLRRLVTCPTFVHTLIVSWLSACHVFSLNFIGGWTSRDMCTL